MWERRQLNKAWVSVGVFEYALEHWQIDDKANKFWMEITNS